MSAIHYTKPSITDLEIRYATDAAANGWGAHCYDYIFRFEKEFCDHLGVKFGIATASCTGAMTLGLHALGITKNDEVILADTNWIATASPICHLNAKPVFVDILKNTWCIDPVKAEAAITPKTKAIIATHLYGNLCDMDALLDIGRRYKIAIIEDSAEAIGSSYKGHPAGSMGTFSTFSFHGTKTLTTGEGGIFVTDDESLYEHVLTLSNHGRKKEQVKQFWPDVLGYKFKMSNIQAAIGVAQLTRINSLVERKRDILEQYKAHFCDIPTLSMNSTDTDTQSGAWMPNLVFGSDILINLEELKLKLHENEIDARNFFWPLSSLPMFQSKSENINSYDLPGRCINLPSFHDISEVEIQKVCSVILNYIETLQLHKKRVY